MAPAILTVGLFFTGIYNFFRYQYRLVPRENVRARRVDLALFGWAGPIGQVLYFAAFLDDNGRTGGGLDWWTALLLLVPAAVLYLVRRRTQTPRPKFRKPYDFFVPLFEVVYSFAFAMTSARCSAASCCSAAPSRSTPSLPDTCGARHVPASAPAAASSTATWPGTCPK